MEFEWNEEKIRANIKKHKISFDEAQEAFNDPLHISILDKRYSYLEERWITSGSTKKGTIVIVGHLYTIKDDGEEVIRILSARKARPKERRQYETIG